MGRVKCPLTVAWAEAALLALPSCSWGPKNAHRRRPDAPRAKISAWLVTRTPGTEKLTVAFYSGTGAPPSPASSPASRLRTAPPFLPPGSAFSARASALPPPGPLPAAAPSDADALCPLLRCLAPATYFVSPVSG
ncbi:hypothetical protein ACP70R_020088 [Stipagrostis hirtigluma subsp. patula]